MTTNYFTLGQGHTHSFAGRTLDKDDIIKITADDPRARMFELFGDKWAMQYDDLRKVTVRFYKRIFDVDTLEFTEIKK